MSGKFPIALCLIVSIFVAGSAQTKDGSTGKPKVLNDIAINLVQPEYPKIAEDLCVGGKVEVETRFRGETGQVVEAKAISGDVLLHEASVKAAKETKFPPPGMNYSINYYVTGPIVYDFDGFVKKKCIDGGILNGKALNLPKPVINRHLRIKTETEIKVRVLVDVFEGKVVAAHTAAGHPLIRSACENAARKATFTPFQHGTQRIFARGIIIYKVKPDRTVKTKLPQTK